MHRDIKPENILLEYNPNSKDSRYTIKVRFYYNFLGGELDKIEKERERWCDN